MQLSKYIIQTTHPTRGPVYFNTVTRVAIPINKPERLFAKHNFLAGQEKAAVRSVLNKVPREYLHLSIAPTWECNMRCTHCMVKHRLIRKQADQLDIDGIINFIQRCKEKFQLTKLGIHFYGGEPLLAIDDCIEIVNRANSMLEVSHTLYTNLAVEITQKHLDFLSGSSSIGVSIDGLEDQHNLQRIPLTKGINPFEITMAGLRQLVLAGLKDKLEVQACLRDEFNVEQTHEDFFRLILQYGVTPERIRVGSIGPSVTNPIMSDKYRQSLKLPLFSRLYCCKFRTHAYCTDVSGQVFSDYYSYTPLGTIYDDPGDIIIQQEKLTEETAPALSDPKCQSCPILGYCWGGCMVIENTSSPLSRYCDDARREMEATIKAQAESGNIFKERKNATI